MVSKNTIKKTTALMLVAGILTSPLNASWKAWADGQIQSTASAGGSIKTKTTTSLSGPSLRVRWHSLGNIKPVHIEAPHMSVGCNGIDIGFGSLSFLNFDELVEKLKGIAAAAPAFAFKMAIDTVCAQCSTIMQDLEEIVNEINNFSLDSCQAAQQLGDLAGKSITTSLMDTVGDGTFSDSLKADRAATNNEPSFLKKGWDSAKNKANSLAGAAKKMFLEEKRMYGSFLNNARAELSPSAGLDGKDFVEIARGLVGDVIVFAPNNQDKLKLIDPVMTVEEFIKASTTDDDKIKSVRITLKDEGGGDVTDSIGGLPISCDAKTIEIGYNLQKKIEDQLKDIVMQFQEKSNLSPSHKNLIATLPGNAYVALNLLAVGVEEFTTEELAEYVVLSNIHAQLKFIFSETLKLIGEYSLNVTPDNEDIRKVTSNLADRVNIRLNEANAQLPRKIAPLEKKLGALVEKKETLIKDKIKGS